MVKDIFFGKTPKQIGAEKLKKMAEEFERISGTRFYSILLKKFSPGDWVRMTNLAASWVESPLASSENPPLKEDSTSKAFSLLSPSEREGLVRAFLEEISKEKLQINLYIPEYTKEILDKIVAFYLNKGQKLSYGDITAIALDHFSDSLL